MSKTLIYSFVVSSIIYSCPPSPIRTSITFRLTTKEKTWVLSSACSSSRPTTALTVNRQRNTHVGVYITPVKCASEDMVSPRSTLRRVYTTPRGRHLCNVLDRSSIVVVSKTKNKASEFDLWSLA